MQVERLPGGDLAEPRQERVASANETRKNSLLNEANYDHYIETNKTFCYTKQTRKIRGFSSLEFLSESIKRAETRLQEPNLWKSRPDKILYIGIAVLKAMRVFIFWGI